MHTLMRNEKVLVLNKWFMPFTQNIFIFHQQIWDRQWGTQNLKLWNKVIKEKRTRNSLLCCRSPSVWGFLVADTNHYLWKWSCAMGCSKDLWVKQHHQVKSFSQSLKIVNRAISLFCVDPVDPDPSKTSTQNFQSE